MYLQQCFENLPVNEDWCFKNVKSVQQWTHGYHRYPAKFLPNLVNKLIEEKTNEGDLIADFFAGCGTTLVEAKVHGRKSVGVDINPIAELITKVKINPIIPENLEKEFLIIIDAFNLYNQDNFATLNTHERIDYWFNHENKCKIAYIYERVLIIEDESIKNFFLVTLSHILKNCSKWLQSSTKPQIDPNKTSVNPFIAFERHAKKMINKNSDFFNKLNSENNLNKDCEIRLEDARNTSIKSNSVSAIITSPPYVTSYEYADIHQLTGYWFEYFDNLNSFRKRFIGTFYSQNQNLTTKSVLGQAIVNELKDKDIRTSKEVANYFNDMYDVAKEMKRVLKKNGYICLVIGNTTFKGVKIKSAEVFGEFLISLGFEFSEDNVIKRSIPNKLIPTIRDNTTGKFSKLGKENSKLVYPEEYILIAKNI